MRFLIVLFSMLFLNVSFAGSVVNANSQNVFLSGYDVVAYFTEGEASVGSPEHEAEWQGYSFLFLNEKHKGMFEREPLKYLPQYSGHCANGLSDGHLVQANPAIFRIIDGKLYLFFSWWGKAQWKFNQQEQIQLADQYWLQFSKGEGLN